MSAPAIRAFVALPMPPEVQRYLQALQRRLNNAAPGAVRWVEPEAMHLTLKFLGDIAPDQVPPIAALVRRAAGQTTPLQLPLTTVGCFPAPLRPRVLWAGLGGDLSRLQALHALLDTSLAALGFERETRPFAPHVTLGRVRDAASAEDVAALARLLQRPPALSGAPAARVDRLVLYRSTLTPSGPVYEHLEEAVLSGSAAGGAGDGA